MITIIFVCFLLNHLLTVPLSHPQRRKTQYNPLCREMCRVSVYVPVNRTSNAGILIGAMKENNITNSVERIAKSTLPPTFRHYATIILRIWLFVNKLFFCEYDGKISSEYPRMTSMRNFFEQNFAGHFHCLRSIVAFFCQKREIHQMWLNGFYDIYKAHHIDFDKCANSSRMQNIFYTECTRYGHSPCDNLSKFGGIF